MDVDITMPRVAQRLERHLKPHAEVESRVEYRHASPDDKLLTPRSIHAPILHSLAVRLQAAAAAQLVAELVWCINV